MSAIVASVGSAARGMAVANVRTIASRSVNSGTASTEAFQRSRLLAFPRQRTGLYSKFPRWRCCWRQVRQADRFSGVSMIDEKKGICVAGRGWLASLFLSVSFLALSSVHHPADAQDAQPCMQITAACEQAGFKRGGVKQGIGLQRDCVAPIVQGTEQPPDAAMPLPEVAPDIVAACKEKNPNFGQGRLEGARAQRGSTSTEAAAENPPAERTDKRPNFVFILTDDLSWNLVQYMPRVAKMRADGATFSNYFVTDSLCCPSRASILTGRYPHNTGIFTNSGNDGGYLSFVGRGHEDATFATALSGAGYRTAMLGKYLNGYQPNEHEPASGWTQWTVAGGGYRGFNYNLNQNGSVVHHGNMPADYLTDVLSETAVDFIAQSASTPFLIEIATFTPHGPFIPAPRDDDAFPGLTAPRGAAFDAAPGERAPAWLKAIPPLSDADKAKIDRNFRQRAQTLLAIDKMIGDLQTAVAAIGQQDNTYFIFSSDNGFHMGEYRLMPGKMTAYDTDIRVPLIITGPRIAAGRSIDAIAENIDLCPTFIDLTGAAPLPDVDGRSLAPLLRGEKPTDWRGAALVEHHGPVQDPDDPDAPVGRGGNPPTYAAIRTPKFLYVEYATGEKEYHDLESDPDQLRNTYISLPNDQKADLQVTLSKLQACRGSDQCLAAGQHTSGATHK